MLNFDELDLVCRESIKNGWKCVGEVEREKVYRLEYEIVEYYTDKMRDVIYTVYNHNPEDFTVEYLDLGACTVLKYLMMIKEEL